MMEIRKAELKDVKQIVEIMNQAKAYFKKMGIPQWQSEYPNEVDVRMDIHKDGAYVVCEKEQVVAYSFIGNITDPNYAHIDGEWLNERPYFVLHRTCVGNAWKGKGIAQLLVTFAEEKTLQTGLHDVRIDTHEMNRSMRRMIEKAGFTYCGIIYVEDGTPRFAYQLEI